MLMLQGAAGRRVGAQSRPVVARVPFPLPRMRLWRVRRLAGTLGPPLRMAASGPENGPGAWVMQPLTERSDGPGTRPYLPSLSFRAGFVAATACVVGQWRSM